MAEFDYNENKVIGIVDFFLGAGNNNAKIEVVGYTDWRNDFHRLSDKEIVDLFPPRGKIFAHNFREKYYHTIGTLVCISVKENEKIGDRLDAYIWDKSAGVYEYGSLVKNLKTSFTANGQFNYNLLKDNNLLDVDQDTFVSSGGRIFLIKADSQERLIPYWKESSLETLNIHDKLFVIGYSKHGEDGKIDITTDEQLLEWYLKNVIKKNWGQVFEKKTFRDVEPLIRDAISVSKGLDGLVVSSRIKRLTHMTRALTLSFEELNELSTLPWLKNTIEQTISVHKAAYLESVEQEKEKELKEIRDRYDFEILLEKERVEKEKKDLERQIEEIEKVYISKQAEAEKQIQDKKSEVDTLDATIRVKKQDISAIEESISRLEKRKDEIINDFSVVREVLGINHNSKSANSSFPIEELNIAENAIPVYQAFIKSIENTFKANNISSSYATVIGQQLIAFKTLLVPDAIIAKAIIIASKKCRYLVEYVSATWRSFADLWEHGLGYIVDECEKNKELMHFLILQNINLTYVPNYMMPLIDIQKGIITKLPGTDKPFPDNLRILCTITKDEVMPLSGDFLQYLGCVDNTISKEHYEKIIAPNDTNIGYLAPQVLASGIELAKDVPNYFRLYIDND